MPGSAFCLFLCGPEPPNHNPNDNRHLTVEDIPKLKEEPRRQILQEDEMSQERKLTKKELRIFSY